MRRLTSHIIGLIFGGLLLSGCSSVKMPKLDGLRLSEFREAAKKINSDFPDVSDAPAVPTDVPSDAVWDQSAKTMIKLRDGFEVPDGKVDAKSQSDIDAEFERLKNKVHAYKADDPIGGVE